MDSEEILQFKLNLNKFKLRYILWQLVRKCRWR